MGYKTQVTVQRPSKYIIALAPHTSNWDFIIGHLYLWAEGFRCSFLIKKEWFFWPMCYVMRQLDGIPVYRTKSQGSTDIIAQQAIQSDTFRLCITPEGTRKRNPEWKKGFYYIALKANLPILLYGLDYKRKLIVCTKEFHPTGDYEKDIQEIKDFYKDFKGKYPEKFAI